MLKKWIFGGLCIALSLAVTASAADSPLADAAMRGDKAAVRTLLKDKVDVNAEDITNGQTSVMFASSSGRAEVVKLLAARGADVNAITKVSQIISMADRYKKLSDGKGTRQITGEGGRSDVSAMGGTTALS